MPKLRAPRSSPRSGHLPRGRDDPHGRVTTRCAGRDPQPGGDDVDLEPPALQPAVDGLAAGRRRPQLADDWLGSACRLGLNAGQAVANVVTKVGIMGGDDPPNPIVLSCGEPSENAAPRGRAQRAVTFPVALHQPF